ncbi:PucR family transcriptional regulator [Lentzea cavernae]|uniref:Transcriptional regulator n=1 Tax=Lentzea cavernae TaxID=2020703 RepID=A0ABQ3MG26_9PSEU|nr:helix-turn-helix domain-containing protein [Lentzea cavernae]GHH43310.1 transcriptional regulator [Lentzea cavernae]
MTSTALSGLVDELATGLSRSVVVNDPAMQMLYASPHYGDEDPVRIRAVLDHVAEPAARGHVLAQGVSAWTRAGLIPANEAIGMHARVCVPVRWEGALLGLLMVMDADQSMTTAELGQVNDAAQDLALVLHAETGRVAPAGSDDDQTVLDLVGPDPSVRRAAQQALHASGRAGRFDVVTAVEISVAGARTTTIPHVEVALRHALAGRRQAAHLVAVTGDNAVVLLGSPEPGEPPVSRITGVLDRVHEFALGHFRCVAGIGSTGEGLNHAGTSLRQAGLARRAAALGLRGPVVGWHDLGVLGPLLSIPDTALTDAVLPDELHRLRAADTDGQLTETVRAYLEAAGNGPVAAERLHVHRTTLYYRLSRLRDLTGLDVVTDGPTRLALHVGLTLADVVRQSEQTRR